ncbi:MAG: nucleotidyltransferase family protein [Thermoleophilaceae bacterium]|nr:nucleotidyltransferase family protein [Thermoleophilaceae bacterium]
MPSGAIATAATTLAVDATAARVTRALREAEIAAILLKGRSFADWLYDTGELRAYSDCDLLVSPEDLERAGTVLSGLGFRRGGPTLPWIGRGVEVDLHDSLVGIRADRRVAWRELHAHSECVAHDGMEVDVLDGPGKTLHVALHAAQHAGYEPHVIEDLKRAIHRVDHPTWRAAARLAERLDASAAFAAALCLQADGRALLGSLDMEVRDPDVEVLLRAEAAPALALGFERLRSAAGLRAKTQVAARALFPEPGMIRYVFGLEEAGPARLGVAYLRRLGWLVPRVIPGLRAWIRARRKAAGDHA